MAKILEKIMDDQRMCSMELERIIEEQRRWTYDGKVASYIPELAKADPRKLGVCIYDINNHDTLAGDFEFPFTIQSISKVITLICALIDKGQDEVFRKVGMEPSSDSFNSLAKLETRESHKPLNPFVNAGAIVCTDLVAGDNGIEKFEQVVNLLKKISGKPKIDVNNDVYRSEKLTGNTNRAIAYYLKGAEVIDKNVEDVLDTYFKLCSIEMTVKDIAKIASVIANNGIAPWSNEKVIPEDIIKIVKALMVTCGLYDASGEFSVRVGMPAKSGVGGGIMAVAPNKMGIAVVGPALDKHGNSFAGIKVLEELSKKERLSIFI